MAGGKIFRALGYLVATTAALTVPIELVSGALGHALLKSLAVVIGGYAAVLFIATLLSREVQLGVQRANRELQGEQSFAFRWIKPSDEHWGFFGDRLGDPLLAILRLVLLVETLVVAFVSGPSSNTFFVGAGGFAVSIILTLWCVSREA